MMCSLTHTSLKPSASARCAWRLISAGVACDPACGMCIPSCIARSPVLVSSASEMRCPTVASAARGARARMHWPDRPRKGERMRFTGKVAVITAFANGIGRATAEIMAREGAVVVGIDNHQDRLDEAVAALRGAGGTAHGRLCDALDPGQVEATVASVDKEFGGVDILVNAVGGSTIIANSGAGVDQLTFPDWQRLIAFNLDGTFLFTRAVVPIMKRRRHGKIVNLASIAGRGLSPTSSSAYAAAKGGIIAFELGPFGITINAIAPSLTLTERIRPHWERRTQEAQAAEIARTPLRRVAEAADQAKVVCFLASSDADFVSGVTIDVTGGN